MSNQIRIFLDHIEAIAEETKFALSLDGGGAPFRVQTALHLGERGATSVYYQGSKLIGISARIRDQGNRTLLFCADLTAREPAGESE